MCLLSAVLEFYLIGIKKKKTVITFKCLVPEDGIYAEFILSILIYLLLILKILGLVITYFLGNINYLISSKLLK